MDVTIKGVPDAIGEQQFREWCSIIVERFENAKLNQIKEVVQATEAAKTGIDSFRVANNLTAKFAKAEEAKVEDAITAG
jgi:hypothetical protein